MTNKPLAKRRPNELRDLIEGDEFRAQLQKVLPQTISPERFVRIVVTSTMRNPRLLECSKETFFRCLLDLSAIGLEPDGRQAHLIPRRNKEGVTECTLVIDYKGFKELFYRNGDIIDEHSQVVGDLDFFEFELGSNRHLTHRPNIRDRGKVYAAYSYVTLPKGGSLFDVMSIDEIELIRKRSASPDKGPWATDYIEMCKKTVFRRLSKSLPLSPKTRDAIEVENTYEAPHDSPSIKTATVGARRELPTEEAAPGPIEPEEPPQEPPTVPDEESTSPPEPVPAASNAKQPPGPLTQIKVRLKEAGFRQEEFLSLLKIVRLLNADVTDINHVPVVAMQQALADWDNVVRRMIQERDNPTQPAQEEFPV